MQAKSSYSVKLLDCTLRDGGYYNDWDFSVPQAQEYIDNLADGGVDIIEVGFRFKPKAKYVGPFAYTTEALLAELHLPKGVQFGVMINASDYLSEAGLADLAEAFVPQSESAVSLVRIAAHIGQVRNCADMVAWLKEAGYDVGFNIMQISQASNAEITDLIEFIEANFVPFEALYFADSLGNLTQADVTRIVGLFRQSSPKPIGFHGHDNIGLGVANSLAAIEAGAGWVDATITGMGRGAGNTQTEYLSLELSRRGLHDFNSLDIQRAATGWLADLKQKCGWGTNIFYYEAGLLSLHPSYVQQMISSQKYQPIDILAMIQILSMLDAPTSYKEANIEAALANLFSHPEGASDITGQWEGRPVMLISGGANGASYWEQARAYAEKTNAVCLAINYVGFVPPEQLAGVVCMHPARAMHLLEEKRWNNVPTFAPVQALPGKLKQRLMDRPSITDYGVQIDAGDTFAATAKGCTIPRPEALAYAWAIAEQAGASEILLVGFDGYDGQSRNFQQVAQLLEQLIRQSTVPAFALSKTHYDLPARSIF